MTEFKRGIEPSRRLFRPRFSAARAAQSVFRGLAKGVVAVAVLAMIVVGVLSGGQGDSPTTRGGRRILMLVVLVILAGAYAWNWLE